MQDGAQVMKDMDRLTAFSKGMSTWARWVDSNVDTSKTKVYFQGISPTHYKYDQKPPSPTLVLLLKKKLLLRS